MNVDTLFVLIRHAMPEKAADITDEEIENLADLIGSEIKDQIDKAIQEEREKCAAICENWALADLPWGKDNTEVYNSQAKFISRWVTAIKAGNRR